MQVKAARFQLIELQIPVTVTGNLQFTYFGQQPQLQSISGDKQIYIKEIEAYTRDMIPFSPFTPSNPVASAQDLINALMYISLANDYAFYAVPLVDLCRIFGTVAPSVYSPFRLKDVCTVDWTKTYVQTILVPPTTPPFSYLFGVYYDYHPDYEDNPGRYGAM
jgi:hypothetical protein